LGDITPLEIPKVNPGPVTLTIALDGYKPLTLNLEMKPGDLISLDKQLQKNKGVRFDQPWINGLGMSFVPYGAERELMVSVWETRVSDYDAFLADKNSGARRPRKPDFAQTKDHPVVYVTRDDARKFCAWLTKRERSEELISVAHTYRLLTDLEWSRIAGIAEVAGKTPGWRDTHKPLVFQWGSSWPPPPSYANLADNSAAKAPGVPANLTITGYDDRFETTAPVGSFAPNAAGIFDMCGNVHEWVDDDYSKPVDGHTIYGVLRGGGWNSFQPDNLYTGERNAVPHDLSDNIYGFRVVLAKFPSKPDNITDP
jgi:formylglycine-generating enzyme required for sulfatase activity